MSNHQIVTKLAENARIGEGLYRQSGRHAVITNVESNGLYTKIKYTEGDKPCSHTYFAFDEIDVVQPQQGEK